MKRRTITGHVYDFKGERDVDKRLTMKEWMRLLAQVVEEGGYKSRASDAIYAKSAKGHILFEFYDRD